jgi:hypothetical protein
LTEYLKSCKENHCTEHKQKNKGHKLEYCYWWMESWLLESWRHYVCFIFFVNFTSRYAALYTVSDFQANVICPWENFQQSTDWHILFLKWHIEETIKSGQSRDTGNFKHKTQTKTKEKTQHRIFFFFKTQKNANSINKTGVSQDVHHG